MTASRAYAIRCRQCQRLRDEVGRPRGDHRVLSYRGLCPECARANMEAEQAKHANPDPGYWDRYRSGTAAAVGARIPTEGDASQ